MYNYNTEEVGITGGPSDLIKLANWEEGGYTVRGKSEDQNGGSRADVGPCGEMHVSGPCMAKGYFGRYADDDSFYTDNDGTHWFR